MDCLFPRRAAHARFLDEARQRPPGGVFARSCLPVSIPSAKELAAAPDTPFDISLRPPAFSEFAGQEKVREQLLVVVEAAKQRGDVLEHAR